MKKQKWFMQCSFLGGMHRMGGGAQMNEFKVFSNSICSAVDIINSLSDKKLSDISETEMKSLQQLFENLNPMKSNKKIVAVSKVLAHYIPNIIAPIDNEYTFQFICESPGRTVPPRNWKEFDLFRDIHFKLFKAVLLDAKFISSAARWQENKQFHWDTSLPKIVDNLIIGKIGHLKRTDKDYKKVKNRKG